MAAQLSLLGRERPDLDRTLTRLRRRDLGDGAWVEHMTDFVRGHQALLADLQRAVAWEKTTQVLYEREVLTPRLTAALTAGTTAGHWPLLQEMAALLGQHCGVRFDLLSAALYRDGQDSVAWHRDRNLRQRHHGFVATVSLGEPRAFLLRPHATGAGAGGGPRSSTRYQLGMGDLFIMGGTCQRTWEHTIPKATGVAGPRLALMFRHSELLPPPATPPVTS
jgi:alkylated DNA repair dioxygenase AlkB